MVFRIFSRRAGAAIPRPPKGKPLGAVGPVRRRLGFEPLEERRLLASLMTLSGAPNDSSLEPGETAEIAVQLQTASVGSSLSGFSLGIFFDSNDLAQVAYNAFSSEARGIAVSDTVTTDDDLPDVSITGVYIQGEILSPTLSKDSYNIDNNENTDWYIQISWMNASSSWISSNITRELADFAVTLKSDFGGMAAIVTVDYRWLNWETIAPGWEFENVPTEIFVQGKLASPSNLSVAASDPARYDSATVEWNPVTGAVGYRVDYSTSSNFSASTTQSTEISDTQAVIEGLLPATEYFFRVTALCADEEGDDSNSSNSVSLTTAAAAPDLATSPMGANFPDSVLIGETIVLSGVTATNDGNGPSGAYTVSFYASTDTTFDSSDVFLGSIDGTSLAYGAAAALSADLSTDSLSSGASYYLVWTVNLTGDVDTANNTAVSTKKIAVAKIALGVLMLDTSTPQIGDTLTASFGDPAPTVDWQWYRSADADSGETGWTAIDGATGSQYVASTADFGMYLRVVAVGKEDWTGTVSADTDAAVYNELTGASISGDLTVGSILKVALTANYLTPGTTDAAAFTYQWTVGETVFSGTTYLLRSTDVGKTVSVTVTAAGNWRGSVSAEASSPVMRKITSVSLDIGLPTVGTVLTATLGPTGAIAAYQWYRDDSAIIGATSASYMVMANDLGSTLKVEAVGDNEKFWTGSVSATTLPVRGPFEIIAADSVQLECDLYLNTNVNDTNLRYLWDLNGDGDFETENSGGFYVSADALGIGERTIALKLRDISTNDESETMTRTVSVLAPGVFIESASALEGQILRLAAQTSPWVGNWVYGWEIDWGEEGQSTETYGQAQTLLRAAHYYQAEGTYQVRVRTLDTEGNGVWYGLTHTVAAAAVAPGDEPSAAAADDVFEAADTQIVERVETAVEAADAILSPTTIQTSDAVFAALESEEIPLSDDLAAESAVDLTTESAAISETAVIDERSATGLKRRTAQNSERAARGEAVRRFDLSTELALYWEG